MYKQDSLEVSYMKQCMTVDFAETNMGFWIDDFYFNVECANPTNEDGFIAKSGA